MEQQVTVNQLCACLDGRLDGAAADVQSLRALAARYPYFALAGAAYLTVLYKSQSPAYASAGRECVLSLYSPEWMRAFLQNLWKIDIQAGIITTDRISQPSSSPAVPPESVPPSAPPEVTPPVAVSGPSSFPAVPLESVPPSAPPEVTPPVAVSQPALDAQPASESVSASAGSAPADECAPASAVTRMSPQKAAFHKAIDSFIADCSSLKPQNTSYVVDIASSIKLDEDLVTETLARVYMSQKMYKKALAVYKKLILKYPEKSDYFAAQIERLRIELI